MLELKKYNSIHAIDPEHWDGILDDEDVFHSWQFIRIVEDGKVENSLFRYLLFYKNDQLVASTVFSAFTISLDIFISDAAWVRKIKQWRPNFFNIKILICGLPASFGQLNLKITDEGLNDEVCSMIATEMKALAKEWNIKFLSVKEFLQSNFEIGKQFTNEDFFLANSIPYMRMKICWDNFEEYISSLRHPYRRHMRQALRKIEYNSPVIVDAEDYEQNKNVVAWVLSKPSWIKPSEYHHLYMQVMSRTKTKLETLNEAFFVELFKDDEHYQLLSLVDNGKIISSALLVPHGDTLTFMLVGREDEKDKYDSYFNLVYGIIAYAIEKKFKKLKLGQTAYWVKQSVGGIPENQLIYFACTGSIRHFILKSLNKLIFPEIKIKPVQVFKKEINVSKVLSK